MEILHCRNIETRNHMKTVNQNINIPNIILIQHNRSIKYLMHEHTKLFKIFQFRQLLWTSINLPFLMKSREQQFLHGIYHLSFSLSKSFYPKLLFSPCHCHKDIHRARAFSIDSILTQCQAYHSYATLITTAFRTRHPQESIRSI